MVSLIPPPDTYPKVDRAAVKLAFYPECHHTVTRDGIEEPCERMAVALRLDFNWSSEGDPYPVCAQHVGRRKGHMVPLLEVMGARP